MLVGLFFDLRFSAVSGCAYVLHVASPFPIVADESVVNTAVDGTLNVLRACAACESVKKVVLTSSCSAVNGESHAAVEDPYLTRRLRKPV